MSEPGFSRCAGGPIFQVGGARKENVGRKKWSRKKVLRKNLASEND